LTATGPATAFVRLETCRDADFPWMLGEGPGRVGARLPPGGVDLPEVLAVVRGIHSAAGGDAAPSTWMIICDDEVVGLCGRSRPVAGGDAEIGYSVTPTRRRRGHATKAVALLSRALLADPAIGGVTAVTAVDNAPSHRVLERNGFVEVGREIRDDDGPVILWRLGRGSVASQTEG
jgi:GNAT superfamily N-acetyltransferase